MYITYACRRRFAGLGFCAIRRAFGDAFAFRRTKRAKSAVNSCFDCSHYCSRENTHVTCSIKTDVVSRTTGRAAVFVLGTHTAAACIHFPPLEPKEGTAFLFALVQKINNKNKSCCSGRRYDNTNTQTRCCRRANNDSEGAADSVGQRSVGWNF